MREVKDTREKNRLNFDYRPLIHVNPDAQDFESYFNATWYIIITITTVGYGDFFARTLPGRTLIFFVCFWGVFVVSMMVVTLTNILSMEIGETKVFH